MQNCWWNWKSKWFKNLLERYKAYDSYFDLVDRLQELYKIGMDKFLKQDIVYIVIKILIKHFGQWNKKEMLQKTLSKIF